jgi:lichenan operon transcriptional antiterminator
MRSERGLRMIHTRLVSILRELMAARNPLTSEYLANNIQVTSRTIRTDMKDLEFILSKSGAVIKSVRGKGYELIIQEDQLFRSFLQKIFENKPRESGFIPILPGERVQYVIRRLLLTNQFVKLEELAEEMYISKSTIQNDLKDVKKILQQYDIFLEKRPNYGLKLIGDELKLRFCMSEYLFNRSQTELDMINERILILPPEEMSAIRRIILEQIKEYQINLSDISLSNLIIHIAIACVRIRHGNYVSLYPEELKDILKQKEYIVASNIVSRIEKALDVLFPKTEIAYITIHLLGNKIAVQPNISEKEIQSFVDVEDYELIVKILDSIENKLKLGIKHDKELIVGIALHIKPAINRYRYGMNLRNPLLDAIKASYPIAFEAGIIAGMVIKQEVGIDINENEIGYLAIHIGAALERSKMNKQVKRCIIVCASGIGSATLLKYKLIAEFGSKLEIAGTTEYYKLHEIPLHTIDFIISTIPISESLPIPIIEVNTIFGGNDFEKIANALIADKEQTLEYTKKELVFLQQRLETKEEVISFLSERLQSLGLVDETFREAVLEREAVAPTSFGNLVAIPHPIIPKTNSTFWAVCTLQKPIDWGGKKVRFVCMLCVEKDSTTDLKKMYDLLLKVVDNEKLVQQLVKCETYNELLHIFLKEKMQ